MPRPPEPVARLLRTRRASADRRVRLSGIGLGLVLASLMLALLWWWRPLFLIPGAGELVMGGGDPYLRALMRTISAGESNVGRSYHVIHGGGFVDDLDHHPNRCETIRGGPNRGRCSTAAGRYQLLYGTWLEIAARYHPDRDDGQADPQELDFSPRAQDIVVHGWLSDRQVWRVNLADQLRQGRLDEVLRRLSGTWTSLGYGIESHGMTQRLPRIYQQVLEQELRRSNRWPPPAPEPGKDKGRAALATRP
ncbi:MAG: glycoside hydrolase family protein [Burkholderiaceae bacterium]